MFGFALNIEVIGLIFNQWHPPVWLIDLGPKHPHAGTHLSLTCHELVLPVTVSWPKEAATLRNNKAGTSFSYTFTA